MRRTASANRGEVEAPFYGAPSKNGSKHAIENVVCRVRGKVGQQDGQWSLNLDPPKHRELDGFSAGQWAI
jgi:hypothetical protein